MTQPIVTKKARKNHSALLASVIQAPAAEAGGVPVSIHCGAEDAPNGVRPGRTINLEKSDVQSAISQCSDAVTLTYSAETSKGAEAALVAAVTPFAAPVAADSQTLALLALAVRVARSDIPVLVEGPTGTGKEVMARYLHDASMRRKGPFIAVNCAAMPEAMLEALLFGHCKGAFTGASEAHEGFFRAADHGTLLLDEIGEMPLPLQVKLLRALQEGEVTPIGATSPVKVDVRVIACTNRHLPQEIAEGRFREDLYYRLNVFPLRLSALRERPDDIAPLAFCLMLKHSGETNQPAWIAPAAITMLEDHPWPGNVRELENVIRRAMLLACDEPQIDPRHIRFDAAARPIDDMAVASTTAISSEDGTLSDIAFRSEADAILQMLNQCGGHRGETARRLGISERTLRYRLANMREAGLAVTGGRS